MAYGVANESWARLAFYGGEYWPFTRRAERNKRACENDAALIAWAIAYRESR